MEELGGATRGTVKVAASTTAGIYVVPPALGAFHRANPQVKLTLDVVNRITAQERLLNDEVDLAVMGLIEHPQDLEVEAFAPNELVVIAAPDHPLTQRRQIPLEALARRDAAAARAGIGHAHRRGGDARAARHRGQRDDGAAQQRRDQAGRRGGAGRRGDAAGRAGAGTAGGARRGAGCRRLPGDALVVAGAAAGRRLSAAAEALWQFLLAYRGEVVSELPPRRLSRG